MKTGKTIVEPRSTFDIFRGFQQIGFPERTGYFFSLYSVCGVNVIPASFHEVYDGHSRIRKNNKLCCGQTFVFLKGEHSAHEQYRD